MKQPKEEVVRHTVPITIRLRPDAVKTYEVEAAMVGMKRSRYLAHLLEREEMEAWPALAALARMISIQAVAVKAGTLSSEQLVELRSIVRELAQIARQEADR